LYIGTEDRTLRKKTLIMLSLLTVIMSGTDAAELKEIKINPLKKTKEQTVLEIIGYQVGDEIDSSDRETIQQRLIKSGLFTSEDMIVDLTITDDQARLELSLKDRITTVPLPIISVSEDEFKAGLFVINSNLRGTGDQFFLGIMASQNSRLAVFSFTNKNIFSSSWDAGGRAKFSSAKTVIRNSRNNEILEYSSTAASAGVFTQWNHDILSLRGGIDAGGLKVTRIEGFPEKTVVQISPSFTAGIDTLHYDEFFPEGFTVITKMEVNILGNQYKNSMTASLKGNWKKLFFPRLQWESEAAASVYNGEEIFSPPVLSPLIPISVRAETQIQGSTGITAAVLDFSWAYLAVPLKFNIGVFDGISGDRELFYGPVTGLNLNLKKIALPAISFVYGWNMKTSRGQFQLNLGIQ